jgi:hypothetical protein
VDQWSCHLFLAGQRKRNREERCVIGFAHGAYIPNFGGYGGYLGVADHCRGNGVGGRLWRLLIQRLQLDAACAGVSLPFVIWESRLPASGASAKEHANWRSRLRLWERVGAWQVHGVNFLTPNFAVPDGPPVAEQLFLVPVDLPAAAFDTAALRTVVAGLHHFVYGHAEGHSLVTATLPRDCRPRLRPLAAPV